jgi:hypothetical protein
MLVRDEVIFCIVINHMRPTEIVAMHGHTGRFPSAVRPKAARCTPERKDNKSDRAPRKFQMKYQRKTKERQRKGPDLLLLFRRGHEGGRGEEELLNFLPLSSSFSFRSRSSHSDPLALCVLLSRRWDPPPHVREEKKSRTAWRGPGF